MGEQESGAVDEAHFSINEVSNNEEMVENENTVPSAISKRTVVLDDQSADSQPSNSIITKNKREAGGR